jgi:hypothetical protein
MISPNPPAPPPAPAVGVADAGSWQVDVPPAADVALGDPSCVSVTPGAPSAPFAAGPARKLAFVNCNPSPFTARSPTELAPGTPRTSGPMKSNANTVVAELIPDAVTAGLVVPAAGCTTVWLEVAGHPAWVHAYPPYIDTPFAKVTLSWNVSAHAETALSGVCAAFAIAAFSVFSGASFVPPFASLPSEVETKTPLPSITRHGFCVGSVAEAHAPAGAPALAQ